MPSLLTAFITLASLCAGWLIGSLVRHRLPDDHLRDDSRDVIKMASGMIATLVALVIGLLVTSSKSTYDQASGGVNQIGAKIILLDRLLARYGPETTAIRASVKEGLFASLGLLAPRNATTWCCLFVCAVSMAGAIYLILEMNRPLEGAVQISPAPLRKALSVIGKSG
jgi:hypothetical protein